MAGCFLAGGAMKREDFIFTIGYHGDTAIVDGTARRQYGSKNARELLEVGLYRSAFCAALFDGELDAFLPLFRELTPVEFENVDQLKRLFGVFEVPDGVEKVTVIK